MNERIKDLVKQSDLSDFLAPNQKTRARDIEKFAELIVRECGQYLDSPEFIGRRDLDWSMVLNEHFGIK